MLTPLIFLAAMAQQPTILTPSDDIWVYPHASDPQKDAYLRVWGDGTNAVAKEPSDAENLSYSYLQWDVTNLVKGRKIKTATLVLFSIADPKITEAISKKSPLEVRALKSGFTEKNWTYNDMPKFYPTFGPEAVFGTQSISPFPEAGKEFGFKIDLLKGPNNFAAYLDKAISEQKPLALALTSKLFVGEQEGVQTIYKLYSKDADKVTVRPQLVLTFE